MPTFDDRERETDDSSNHPQVDSDTLTSRTVERTSRRGIRSQSSRARSERTGTTHPLERLDHRRQGSIEAGRSTLASNESVRNRPKRLEIGRSHSPHETEANEIGRQAIEQFFADSDREGPRPTGRPTDIDPRTDFWHSNRELDTNPTESVEFETGDSGGGTTHDGRSIEESESVDTTAPTRGSTTAADGTESAPPIVSQALNSSGKPLPPSVRRDMERLLDMDLGSIRIHTGPLASKSATAMDARAYTVGTDLVFRSGEYDPHTPTGRGVLAHELAHVRQQSGGVPVVQRVSLARSFRNAFKRRSPSGKRGPQSTQQPSAGSQQNQSTTNTNTPADSNQTATDPVAAAIQRWSTELLEEIKRIRDSGSYQAKNKINQKQEDTLGYNSSLVSDIDSISAKASEYDGAKKRNHGHVEIIKGELEDQIEHCLNRTMELVPHLDIPSKGNIAPLLYKAKVSHIKLKSDNSAQSHDQSYSSTSNLTTDRPVTSHQPQQPQIGSAIASQQQQSSQQRSVYDEIDKEWVWALHNKLNNLYTISGIEVSKQIDEIRSHLSLIERLVNENGQNASELYQLQDQIQRDIKLSREISAVVPKVVTLATQLGPGWSDQLLPPANRAMHSLRRLDPKLEYGRRIREPERFDESGRNEIVGSALNNVTGRGYSYADVTYSAAGFVINPLYISSIAGNFLVAEMGPGTSSLGMMFNSVTGTQATHRIISSWQKNRSLKQFIDSTHRTEKARYIAEYIRGKKQRKMKMNSVLALICGTGLVVSATSFGIVIPALVMGTFTLPISIAFAVAGTLGIGVSVASLSYAGVRFVRKLRNRWSKDELALREVAERILSTAGYGQQSNHSVPTSDPAETNTAEKLRCQELVQQLIDTNPTNLSHEDRVKKVTEGLKTHAGSYRRYMAMELVNMLINGSASEQMDAIQIFSALGKWRPRSDMNPDEILARIERSGMKNTIDHVEDRLKS